MGLGDNLLAAAMMAEKGSGGGGTANYNQLSNKPQINGNTLTGNKTAEDLDLQNKLVNRENIKSVNGNTLLGEGNLDVGGATLDADTTGGTLQVFQGKDEGLQLVNLAQDVITMRVSDADDDITKSIPTKGYVDNKITEELSKFDKMDYQIVDTLPATGEAGVRYLVKHPTDAQFEEYIYVSDKWYDIGSTNDVDLTNYYDKTETDALLDDKQDALVSGTNVKTVGGQSVLGGGNIPVGFVAEYQVTTAQQIIEYLDSGVACPIVIKRGNDYYTTILSQKVNDTRVSLRAFGTISGSYYVFTYTITNGTWTNASQGLQNLLVSGTNIKTINGQTILGSGDLSV